MTPEQGLPRAQALLAASAIFGRLDARTLGELAARGQRVQLDYGAPLFLKGDDGDAAYIVLDGELAVRAIGPDGREVRIAAIQAGGLIGEMAVLDGAARSADVVAARRSVLWRLPRAAVLDCLRANGPACLALLVELSSRLRAANAALELVSRRDLAAQLASLLLAQMNRLGHATLTQTEMARRIGFSREKVNRKLHDWTGQGWVELMPQGVRVTAPDALRRLAP